MKHLRILALAATALIAAATAAAAQEAYTTGDVNMRAGPGTRYPAVAGIPEDSLVYIHGCLSDWDWCDVSWQRSRGWVFSDYLEALYHHRRIGFDEYRGYVEIPMVGFSFGYWDRYYRDRPWYGSWDRWGDRNDRLWRERHRSDGGGDWNNNRDWNDQGSGGNDQADQGNWRHRRGQTDQNGDGQMRCAPDDPSCYGGSDRRRRMDQPDQMDQNDQ